MENKNEVADQHSDKMNSICHLREDHLLGWKELTKEANILFQKEEYESSLRLYTFSLEQGLDSITKITLEPEASIAAVLISYFNLADVYARLDSFEKSISQFELAHDFLRDLSQAGSSTDLLREAAENAKNRLHFEWCHFVKQHQNQAPLIDLQLYKTLELQPTFIPSEKTKNNSNAIEQTQ